MSTIEPFNGMAAFTLRGVSWRKSQHSNPNGSCVEVAGLAGGVIAIRNSRDPRGPVLIYPAAELAAFVRAAKDGQFDELSA